MCARREVTLLSEELLHRVYSAFNTLFPLHIMNSWFSVLVLWSLLISYEIILQQKFSDLQYTIHSKLLCEYNNLAIIRISQPLLAHYPHSLIMPHLLPRSDWYQKLKLMHSHTTLILLLWIRMNMSLWCRYQEQLYSINWINSITVFYVRN